MIGYNINCILMFGKIQLIRPAFIQVGTVTDEMAILSAL